MQSFYNSLSDDGVLVIQLGESPDWRESDETKSGGFNRVAALNLLEKVGFESIHVYEEVSRFHSCLYERQIPAISPIP